MWQEVEFCNAQGSQHGIQKGTSFPVEVCWCCNTPLLCCCGLPLESSCINCDSSGDSRLLLPFVFARSQRAPAHSDSPICVIYKRPHPHRSVCVNRLCHYAQVTPAKIHLRHLLVEMSNECINDSTPGTKPTHYLCGSCGWHWLWPP